MSQGKARKKDNAQRVAPLARREAKRESDSLMPKIAEALVDPGGIDPLVFPSPLPGRASSARYKFIMPITGLSDFGVIVQPDVQAPIQVTHLGVLPETNVTIAGSASGMVSAISSPLDILGSAPCMVESELIGGRPALPLVSTAVSVFSWQVNVTLNALPIQSEIFGWNGVVWTSIGTIDTGGANSISKSTPGLTFANTYTHYSMTAKLTALFKTAPFSFTYGLFPVGVWSCVPSQNQFAMDVFAPEWDTLNRISPKFSIVAMDCLLTYEGSTLENAGSVAVCNSEQDLEPAGSWYETVGSQPYDSYRGRLASSGQSEGGGHWHYVPDDLEALSMDGASPKNMPRGYFGVSGMDPTQITRIQVYFIINFFTVDQSYQMSIQPPMTSYGPLLYHLRRNVPLVSSNDLHVLKKIKALAKKGAKHVAAHPEQIGEALAFLAAVAAPALA